MLDYDNRLRADLGLFPDSMRNLLNYMERRNKPAVWFDSSTWHLQKWAEVVAYKALKVANVSIP